jgi:hypothetical protein
MSNSSKERTLMCKIASRLIVFGLSLVFRLVFFVNVDDFASAIPNKALNRSPGLQYPGTETAALIHRKLPRTI